jgi:hypothetical protein
MHSARESVSAREVGRPSEAKTALRVSHSNV